MKLPHPISVSLLEFFRTGRFDCLSLGETKEWILHNFPDPDVGDVPGHGRRTSIWGYGAIELHFEGEELWMIYSDHLDRLVAGSGIALDPWLLATPGDCTLARITQALIDHGLALDIQPRPRSVEVEIRDSGVRLFFEEAEDGDLPRSAYTISAFSCRRA